MTLDPTVSSACQQPTAINLTRCLVLAIALLFLVPGQSIAGPEDVDGPANQATPTDEEKRPNQAAKKDEEQAADRKDEAVDSSPDSQADTPLPTVPPKVADDHIELQRIEGIHAVGAGAAGIFAGGLGFAGGALIGVAFCNAGSDSGPEDGDFGSAVDCALGVLLGGTAGYIFGAPAGVYGYGRFLGLDGRYLATLGGTTLGLLGSGLLMTGAVAVGGNSTPDILLGAIPLILVPAGGIMTFNESVANNENTPAVSLIDIGPRGTVRVGAPLIMSRDKRDYGIGWSAQLIGGRF